MEDLPPKVGTAKLARRPLAVERENLSLHSKINRRKKNHKNHNKHKIKNLVKMLKRKIHS
jgi:hypothetical protein